MNERLLIVEDDVEIARIEKEHLTRAGYEVTWASTGKEGLEDFKKQNYDLVMVDIMMPEMDGFTLCKNIRLISEVPILIISAKISDDDKVKGLKIGADDYITKPFSLRELTARVESHLRRYKKNEKDLDQDRFEFKGELAILKGKKEVIVKGQEIHLTVKEFELLVLMSQNPNHVFTKKELYENVWNELEVDGNNTVTVHVKELRNKLQDDVKNPSFIQTVWGVGYKFIGEKIL